MSLAMNVLRPLIVTCVLIAAWFFTPLGAVPMSRIIPGAGIPYTIIFFCLLLACLFFLLRKIDQASWISALAIAIIFGHLGSIFSITVAELLTPNGLERWNNSLRLTGFAQLLGMRIIYPILLAGWIVAPLAVAGVKIGKGFVRRLSN